MKRTPIFDTSAIINLAGRDASDEIWPRLRKRLPARGCPLSFVTVLELLDGLSRGGLTHSVSVISDTLISGYRFEENPNDFHDGMQLLYLARPSFCLVTDDAGLIRRVEKSSQRDRILTLDEFISAQT